MPRVDLHAHTTASDGLLAPAALVEHAARAGVDVLAVTDHDTFAGVAEARARGDELGVRVIPGVELTIGVPHGSMHLLGYFADPAPDVLVERLSVLSELREARARAIVDRLCELGVPVDFADVRARAAGNLGRPHIAAAMVAAGHAESVSDAFDRWLGDGRRAHVAQRGLDPHEAIALVRAAGGAPVLAHPGSLRLPRRHLASFVQGLAARGLAGIEVHRPDHTAEQRDRYAAIAGRLRLIPCGGSDFHDPGGPVAIGDSGEPGLPAAVADRLATAIR